MEKVKVTYKDKVYEYDAGISFKEIIPDFQDYYEDDIVLASVDGSLRELWKKLDKDCEIDFYTTKTPIGSETYRRSLTFMMIKSVYDALGHDKVKGVRVFHSIGSAYFCKAYGDFKMDETFISLVKTRMKELVDKNTEIKKSTRPLHEAIERFENYGMNDKVKLFNFRNSSDVHTYTLNNFEDYYYGYMVPNCGYLKYFDLFLYDDGFVLEFPTLNEPRKLPEFKPSTLLFNTQKEAISWADMQNIRTVGDLNSLVVNGDMQKTVLIQEAIHEKQIADIAKQIADRPDVKVVLIAGPSSSSKTSFSHRLTVQLSTLGLLPHPIACDNYFVDRHLTPKDENGNYDFECLEAVDMELLNSQLLDLMDGKEVNLPTYNFIKGEKEYHGDKLKLGDSDIIVLEGIHCLNDKLTYKLSSNNKFKIYVSALTQLSIDEHNRIPTTDGRLIRRMIRDARTRGMSATDTIKMWPNVRKGEELYIFPYQDSADVMFNSAAIYELAVFKQYCMPLLFSVDKSSPEYLEAKRLRKFLEYFVGINVEYVPNNSLIREFIGGSIFPVG